jgi:hypothetical protein
MSYKYNIRTGVKKIKTKTALTLSGAVLGLAGLIMAVAIPLGAKAAVGGPVCDVPTDYPTIQAAVNDPGCSTINVASGTYNENVVIPRALTLNGAQAGVDARTRSGAESIINGGLLADITVTANNVTVDGFTLNGPANSGLAAIVMQNGNTGETIQNNIINNPGRAASITTSNTIFRQNVVNNTATATDGFQTNTLPVSNLTISDNNFSGANPAFYNADITVIEGNSNVTVSGNSSNGDGTLVALFKTNGAQVAGNTVIGGGGSSAIYIGGSDSNVTVSGNQISAAGSAVRVANDFGVGPNSAVTITGNTLQNNVNGVRVTVGAVTDTVVAHQNNLVGNTAFGITNDATTPILNGECNWWGAANGPGPVGPGSGDRVSINVDYTPWLVAPTPGGSCIGGNLATNKDQCKNGGWMTMTRRDGSTFKNQGDCVSYTNNGR